MTMRGEDQNHDRRRPRRRCELCAGAAAVYCPSDSAYLCFACDARVHYANFLVARHVRAALCSFCYDFSGYRFSGHVQSQARSICPSCVPASLSAVDPSREPSISSTTGASGNTSGDRRHRELPSLKRKISNSKDNDNEAGLTAVSDSGFSFGGDRGSSARPAETGSSAGRELPPPCEAEARGTIPPRIHDKVEGVFKNWCREIGGLALRPDNSDPEWSVAFLSRNALHIFRGMPPALPGRLSLAASFWLALVQYSRFSSSCDRKRGSVWSSPSDCHRASQDLCRRIEEISGVPASSIFAVGSRFAAADHHVSKRRRLASPGGDANVLNGAGDQEEGWGETDP